MKKVNTLSLPTRVGKKSHLILMMVKKIVNDAFGFLKFSLKVDRVTSVTAWIS